MHYLLTGAQVSAAAAAVAVAVAGSERVDTATACAPIEVAAEADGDGDTPHLMRPLHRALIVAARDGDARAVRWVFSADAQAVYSEFARAELKPFMPKAHILHALQAAIGSSAVAAFKAIMDELREHRVVWSQEDVEHVLAPALRAPPDVRGALVSAFLSTATLAPRTYLLPIVDSAVHAHLADCVDILLQHPRAVPPTFNFTHLIQFAAQTLRTELLQVLLDRSKNHSMPLYRAGCVAALHVAIRLGRIDNVALMLRDPRFSAFQELAYYVSDTQPHTPMCALRLAIHEGHVHIVQLILDMDAFDPVVAVEACGMRTCSATMRTALLQNIKVSALIDF